jgi:hypothetical protein
VKPADMEDEVFIDKLGQLQTMAFEIIRAYVQTNSPSDLGFPDHIRNELCGDFESLHCHPYIFNTSKFYIRKLLQQTSFPKFVRNATRISFAAVNVEPPKYTINQIVANEFPAPYSYTDYHEFLKKSQAEENLEFLAEILKYQQLAVGLHPTPSTKAISRLRSASSAPPPIYIENNNQFSEEGPLNNPLPSFIPPPSKPAHLTEEEYVQFLNNVKSSMELIINTYVKSETPREVNLPILIRKPLIQAVQDGHTHPDILNAAYEHIASMLRLNGFSKFLKNAFQTARFNAILEVSVPKYSMHQLLHNELPKPYSRKDYREFLVRNHCDENLDFLTAVLKYEKDAFGFYINNSPPLSNTNRDSITLPSNGNARISTIQMSVGFELTDPVKPENMPQDEYDRRIASLHASALDIIKEFITPQSKREINIPVVIKRPILNNIELKKYHPAIFYAAKKHITDVLQANTLSKFLRTTYEEKINGGLSLKLATGLKTNIDQLMLNELPFPYTYQTFLDYCKTNECAEGVEILHAIMQYQKLAIPLFSIQDPVKKRQSVQAVANRSSMLVAPEPEFQSPVCPKDMSNEEYQALLKKCETSWKAIFETYILEDTPKFIAVPPIIFEQLKGSFDQNCLHPDVFTRIYDYFATNLENQVWEPYHKSFEGTPVKSPEGIGKLRLGDYPKYTIKQIIQKETISPYSYDDYMEFLKKELCDECLEFLSLVHKYQLNSASLYPNPVIKPSPNSKNTAEFVIPEPEQPKHLSKTEYDARMTESVTLLKQIVDTYVRPDSAREVNLPVYIRKPFLKLYDQGKCHPDLLIESFDHIANMLRLNNLTKFLKKAYQNDPNKKEVSPQRVMAAKVTIKEVILNELPSPRSLNDFKKFLMREVNGIHVAC